MLRLNAWSGKLMNECLLKLDLLSDFRFRCHQELQCGHGSPDSLLYHLLQADHWHCIAFLVNSDLVVVDLGEGGPVAQVIIKTRVFLN